MLHDSSEQERICIRCGARYRTKWRYARCAACRYRESYKDLCSCGNLKGVSAPLCRTCTVGAPLQVPTLSPEQAAWVAGLFEAEGTFVLRPKGGGFARLEMTDEDVINRLFDIVQVGSVHAYAARAHGTKPSWRLSLARREYISWLAVQIAPTMSARRREAMERLAANFHPRFPIPAVNQSLPVLPDPVAAAWLAGLIEGDGCIRSGELSVHSVDRDVVDRILIVADRGQIYPIRRQKAHHKDAYAWKATSKGNIAYVLNAIRPWLLARRTAAANLALGRLGPSSVSQSDCAPK